MNARAKEALRWSVIVGSGGFGVYILAACLPSLFTRPVLNPRSGWMDLVLLLLVLPLSTPFLLIAYCCWRRQYHELVSVLNGIGAVCVWFTLNSLSRPLLPLTAPRGDHPPEDLWVSILRLAAAGCLLLGPFYAAGWFHRFAQRLTTRWFLQAERLPLTVPRRTSEKSRQAAL